MIEPENGRMGATAQSSTSDDIVAETLYCEGVRYLYGEGGEKVDEERARALLTAASERNHAAAKFELSHLLGVINETDQSTVLMLQSADLGFGPALLSLARSPDDLTDDKRDEYFAKAREWYLKRAIEGDAEAQCTLGYWIEEKEKERYRWIKAAANQDFPRACYYLGLEILDHPSVNDAIQQGIYWLTHAGELGHWNACRDLAILYLLGNHRGKWFKAGNENELARLVSPDHKKAVVWFERGIELGDREMAYRLGRLYLYGDHLDQDVSSAEKWLLHAAGEGHDSAQKLLGLEYAAGNRFRLDADAAIHWLERASESLTSTGLHLAEIYLDGKIVERNLGAAIHWLMYTARTGVFRSKAIALLSAKCFDGRFSAAEEATCRECLQKIEANPSNTRSRLNHDRG